jgi:hypothetical protein
MPVGIPDEVVAELIRYARRGEVLQFDSLVQGLVDNLRRHGAANAADNIRAANHAGTGLNLADGPAAGKKAGPIKVPAQFASSASWCWSRVWPPRSRRSSATTTPASGWRPTA